MIVAHQLLFRQYVGLVDLMYQAPLARFVKAMKGARYARVVVNRLSLDTAGATY